MAEEDIDIASNVESIADDLGLGNANEDHDDEPHTPAPETPAPAGTPAKPGEESTPATSPAPETPVTRKPPQSWAKDYHERWSKLDPDTQAYVERREKEYQDGVHQYKVRADTWETAVKDYMPLIQAQGIQPPEAVRYLFEAHRQLSSGTPEQKAAYLAKVAQSYGIDFAKSQAQAAAASDEHPSVKELRERTERIERDREQDRRRDYDATSKKVASEVQSFAEAKDDKGIPKHPYFDECSDDIVVLINAGHTLEQAYDKAIYANPVTRAKELERLRKADDEALRAKAKDEAEKARNSSRTNVNSRDTRRQPTAPAKSRSLDEVMDETFKEMKARTH